MSSKWLKANKNQKGKRQICFSSFQHSKTGLECSRATQGEYKPRHYCFFFEQNSRKITFSLQRWFSQAVLLHRLWNSQHLAENSEENYTNFLGKATRLWDLLRVDTRIPKIKPSVARKEKEEEEKKKTWEGRKEGKQQNSKRNKIRFLSILLNHMP